MSAKVLVNLTLTVAAIWVRSGAKAKPEAHRRLMQVFVHLVELEFGDRMDEAAEKQAYVELARGAVEIDAEVKEKQSPLRAWILAGFEAGTASYESFSDAYNAAYTEFALRAQRQGR